MRGMMLGMAIVAALGGSARAWDDLDLERYDRAMQEQAMRDRMERIEEKQREIEWRRQIDDLTRPSPPPRY